MSFGFDLGAGLRALMAARMGMTTAGNNVANANTPGYTRQRVDLVSAMPYTIGGFQLGSGVDVAGITRLVDTGLERRLRLQLGMVGGAEVDASRLDELEGLLNEPDGGLSDGLAGFFGSIGQLQTDPADRALRGGVVQSGNTLAQGFQLLAGRLRDLGGSTFDDVRGLVRQANALADQVAQLNGQITALEANGNPANDLRDTRDQHIKELSQLVDVNAIERSTGSVDLLVGGQLMVAGTRAATLSVAKSAAQKTELHFGTGGAPVRVQEGRIAALMRHESSEMPGYGERVDRLARNLILEVNRRQTTGMPRSGPCHSLTSYYGAADGNGNGQQGDELLGESGFPFAVTAGDLYVTVTDNATGEPVRTRVAVDPAAMTLRDFAARLSSIAHLSASVDPTGRLRVTADDGYGFDFSPRLDPHPDDFGSFGGSQPAAGSSRMGPFDLSGQTFPVAFTVTTGTATAPVTTTVTLPASAFANPAAATTDELVAAINAGLGAAATAANVGGRLVLRSNAGGAAVQLSLANVGTGTALASLGLPTATVHGQDNGVAVNVEGTYTGADNSQLLFVPSADGQIGVTPDLKVDVLDARGNLVTTLAVGSGYQPGTALDLGNGVKVAFGPGNVAASAGNVCALDLLADSDTSDVLVALGMNSFFHGSGAADIEVNPDLLDNVDALAAGVGTAAGDAGNLQRLLGLRSTRLGDLDTNTVEDFWANVVGDVGFATAGAQQTLQTQNQLLSHLQDERESISGVNLDEEMLDVTRYQQSFDAASRYLGVVQDMTQSLIDLGR